MSLFLGGMSLVTEKASRDVTTVLAAVVDERRLSGPTHNPRRVSPALRADGRWLFVVVRVLVRHRVIHHRHCKHQTSATVMSPMMTAAMQSAKVNGWLSF
jgi:hypothetical protein